ncbi:MAG TPA: prolyl oligopeptidase family serine peptidase [Burkholderiaceae bacterium]|nr:prolyl oligopeptidase family serine peptidase [Burkholderiaceae bacterium]
MKPFAAALAIVATAVFAQAPTEVVPPNPNLLIEGIPAIPQSLAVRVGGYSDFRGHGFADWHPVRREMLVSHRAAGANVNQLFLLAAPGASAERLTDFPEPISNGSFDPRNGRFIVYSRDTGGNEASRIYRLDLDTRASTLLSDPETRSEAVWNEAGTRLLIAAVPLDRTAQGGRRDQIGVTLTLVDPLNPDDRRVVAELPGTGWFDFTFSRDDEWLVMIRYISRTETEVWRMEVASGKRERLLPTATATTRATYFGLEFSPDGSRLYLTTTARSEFQQLAEYRFSTRTLRYFSPDIPWDVEAMALSPDGRRIAAVFNVDGRDELRLFDPVSGKELARPTIPAGQISGLRWHEKRVSELAFTLNSPQSPATVYSVDTARGAAQRWTTADTAGVDPASFRDAEVVRWKSFDGRTISGVLTLPPARFTGPRPVIVAIHGGPEAQATVNFNGRFNYLINELGIALLEPNVRGSSGYGKTFLDLDNGVKREDSVRDIGALLDWIATDQRLDAKRVMVQGGSYGGYMVLASLVHYSERLRGGIDVVGISDFVSFLGNTESYRRDLRRVEYGDERDPAVRSVLDQISPLANAGKIRAPLLVVHGKNDPRVPVSEARQIVQKVRANGVPVWYLEADNEGHGFARKINADYYFYSMVAFIERYLLGN